MIASIEKKNVLFITTKRLDYIRNTQEIRLLEKHTAYFHIVGANDKSYFFRLIRVYIQLLFTPVKPFDTVFIGFSPQLILPFWGWKLGDKYRIIDFFICWILIRSDMLIQSFVIQNATAITSSMSSMQTGINYICSIWKQTRRYTIR